MNRDTFRVSIDVHEDPHCTAQDAAAGSKPSDGGMPSEADSEAQVKGGALAEHQGDSSSVAAPEQCTQPIELAPEMQSPEQGLCSTAQKACSPLLEVGRLPLF